MRRLGGLIVAWTALMLLAGHALAQSPAPSPADEDQPVLFRADEVSHDRELGIVVATGNVEMVQGDRVLLADTVSYNQRTDVVTATGNVSLLEPTGDIVFADHVELTGDFREGIIENIRILMSDNGRLAAAGGRRSAGNITEMSKAVYSPCRTCAGMTGDTPIWQIKAVEVVHDEKEKTIEYTDAFMEFFGVPVIYTPYFSHPDPTVKRKSGFLAPGYGADSSLGLVFELPYYFNIAPDKDATLRPIVTGKEGLVLAGEYRQRFADGNLTLDLSGTHGSKDNGEDGFRGHFFAESDFDLDRTWRSGAQVQLASDDTYLQRYDFSDIDVLENRVFLEGFRARNYAIVQGYHWRGLRQADDPGQMPIVAPLADFSFIGAPGPAGGRWQADANMLVLTRTDGTDSRRLSLISGWQLPHIARSGEIYNLWAEIQTDAYFVDEVQEPDNLPGDTSSGFAGRIFPRIGLDWRYPFARQDGPYTQIIEPVAGITLSPNGGGNDDRIPNEDSLDFEFDDTNLLSRNRFTGLDRVEGGQRVHYGLKMGVYGPGGGYSSFFVGQSYRLREDDTFAEGSGLEDNLSHFVGRVQIRPQNYMNLLYRLPLDKDDLTPRRNELTAAVGPRAFNISANYLFLDDTNPDDEFGRREEITGVVSSQITPDWGVSAFTRHDIDRNATLDYGLQLRFLCDCFNATLTYTRTFTEDRDVKPSNSVFLRLEFKNLGAVETGG